MRSVRAFILVFTAPTTSLPSKDISRAIHWNWRHTPPSYGLNVPIVYSMEWSLGAVDWSQILERQNYMHAHTRARTPFYFCHSKISLHSNTPLQNSAPRLHSIEYTLPIQSFAFIFFLLKYNALEDLVLHVIGVAPTCVMKNNILRQRKLHVVEITFFSYR